MNTENCFEIYNEKLAEYKNLANETKYALLKSSIIKINNVEIKHFEIEKMFDYLLLNRFYHKAFVYSNDLITEYRKNKKTKEKISNFFNSFALSNKEFMLKPENLEEIFIRNFSCDNGYVELDDIFKFFEENSLNFLIKNEDFVDISFKTLLGEQSLIINNLNLFFDVVDIQRKGIVYFKGFEDIMSKIFDKKDSRWQNNEYFL